MTTCDRYAELLLEADVAELRGETPGPLGSHLAQCEHCRRRARVILDDHDRLERALVALERRQGVVRPRRFRPARAAALLLPAAAAAGALFLLRPAEPSPHIDPAALYAALNPARPLIETDPHVRAAVVSTEENVTVVLLYQGDR